MRNNNKILIIWSSEWPWDVRIDKQIKTLINNNYDVSIIARNTTKRKSEEIVNNIHIFRVGNILPNNSLDNVISTPIYINPLWIIKILKTIIRTKPNIILIREIPLAPITIILAKMFNIKVVLDIAEHFPALMRVTKKYINNPLLKFLICSLGWYDYIEKFSVKNCDKILVVVKESKDRLIKQYKICEDKIEIVSNTPIEIPKSQIYYQYTENLKIVYTGNIDGKFRGIQTILEAAEILKEHQNIEFNIIGDGAAFSMIKQLKNNKNLHNINLLGRFEHFKLLEFLRTQSLGIVPHTKSDVIEYTIPNKLFDYMSYSLPLIVSSATPLKRIVEETNCGYIFEAENPKSLADLILSLFNKKQELFTKAQNGYNAIVQIYNWSKDEKKFCNILNQLLNKKGVNDAN